jgi:hypothetical protein
METLDFEKYAQEDLDSVKDEDIKSDEEDSKSE